MNRTLLAIIMLCIAGASAAQDVKPSAQDARASMPFVAVGFATYIMSLRLGRYMDDTGYRLPG